MRQEGSLWAGVQSSIAQKYSDLAPDWRVRHLCRIEEAHVDSVAFVSIIARIFEDEQCQAARRLPR